MRHNATVTLVSVVLNHRPSTLNDRPLPSPTHFILPLPGSPATTRGDQGFFCQEGSKLQSRWNARNVGLWTLACLPFGLSLIVHGAATPKPLSIAVAPLPALAFNQYQVDLGAIQAMPEVRAMFVFQNRGQHPVEIIGMRASCGCLLPRLSKSREEAGKRSDGLSPATSIRYQPGESDGLSLRVQPSNEKPGQKEYFVDVLYTDPEPREVRLKFKLVIPEKQLLVSPKALIFFQLGERETTQDLKVTNARGTELQIIDAQTSSPYISLKIGEQLPLHDGNPQQVVHVTAVATVPEGRHHSLITLRTTDPDQPEIRVPVMVQGGQGPAARPVKEPAAAE